MTTHNTREGIEETIAKIDGANVAGGDIHSGLHNAINHVFFSDGGEEFGEARDEVFTEVRYILKTILHQELQKARHDCLLEAIEKIEIARQEHNDARHGDSTDDAYDRACDAINPDLHQSELDHLTSVTGE